MEFNQARIGRTVSSEARVQKKEQTWAHTPQKPGAAYKSGFIKETEHGCVLRNLFQGTGSCDCRAGEQAGNFLSLGIHETNASIYPNFIEYLVAPHSNSCSFKCGLQSPLKPYSMIGTNTLWEAVQRIVSYFKAFFFNCCIAYVRLCCFPFSLIVNWEVSLFCGIIQIINWLWSQCNWGSTEIWHSLVLKVFI